MANNIITWGIFILTIILGITTITLFILNSYTPVPATWGSDAGVRSGVTDWINLLFLSLLIPITSIYLGAVIIAQRPRQSIDWLLIILGFTISLTGFLGEFNIYTNFTINQNIPGQTVAPWVENWLWVVVFGVVILQQLFRALTGHTSPLAILISTLIIAALFNPIREPLQRYIDRGFYHCKYKTEQALRYFSFSLRQEVNVNVLANRLLAIV